MSIYFQERSNVKSTPETQVHLTTGKKKNDLNFKENKLKTAILYNLETWILVIVCIDTIYQ